MLFSSTEGHVTQLPDSGNTKMQATVEAMRRFKPPVLKLPVVFSPTFVLLELEA